VLELHCDPGLRDTQDRQGPVLAIGRPAWQAFAAKLKDDRRG
jgi:Domain of unknown function (DUF397)